MDADLNASRNIRDISLLFGEISYNSRYNFDIQKGFFWNKNYEQEFIVSVPQKT